MPNEIESYINILITCSDDELRKRLKARDESRQCGSDEYIDGQINYQNFLLKNIKLFQRMFLYLVACKQEEMFVFV